jgi:hypothetical protein
VSAKLAELELRHVIAVLDRVRHVEKDVERLQEAARDTLALVKKESRCATFPS